MKMTLLAAALAALSLSIYAQMGPNGSMGGNMGGPGSMGPHFDAKSTPGWNMMTPEERKAHQDRMHSMKDPTECQAYMEEHHKLMEARAKEQGKALPGKGPGPGCDYLKKKG